MSPRNWKRFAIAAAIAALFAMATPATVHAQPFGAWMILNGPTNGYSNIASVPALNPTSSITIEAWVNITDAQAGGCSSIAGKGFHDSWWIGICGTDFRSYLSNRIFYSAGTIPHHWTHIAVTFDGTTRRHYINGELVGARAEAFSTLTTNINPVQIGSDVDFSYTPNGSLNEVRLWSVARTQAQIRSTINVPITSTQPGLIAVWSDGVHDAVGAHAGTLVGSVSFLNAPVTLNCGSTTATSLCLNTRFSVSATFRVGAPGTAESQAHVAVANSGSGIFWFFASDTWEVLVKSLNGCALNSRYWIFSAATTNVFYRMNVFDIRAGVNKIYFNYPGPPAPAVTDTDAFATCP
ncbi:MAG: LamG domain-containing protein [Acidobacteriota bacterium]